jgi:hypothetical protein
MRGFTGYLGVRVLREPQNADKGNVPRFFIAQNQAPMSEEIHIGKLIRGKFT